MIRSLATILIATLLSACAQDPYQDWHPLAATQTSPSPEPASLDASWQTIAHSREARPIQATTLGTGPTRVYLIAGIHGDEPEGQLAIDDIAREFRPDRRITLRIVADMNPDGTAADRRTNARGVDLNRNWPASNFSPSTTRGHRPLSEPESAAIHDDMLEFDPDLVLVFHSSSRVYTPFVNYDGPASALAETFASAAKPHALHWGVVPTMGYPTPGSLGSYMGIDREIPILTIEFQLGQAPDSVRRSALAGLDAIFAQGRTGARFATGN